MYRLGKYKWSLVAVAVLLLLAFCRNQFARKSEFENVRQPVMHQFVEPQFAAIPEPIQQTTEEFVALQSPEPTESLIAEVADVQLPPQESARIELGAGGGDFETSENQQPQLHDLVIVNEEPELVSADFASQEPLRDPNPDLTSENTSTQEVVNPVLNDLQSEKQIAAADSFQTIPNFEPAFAHSSPDRPIQLPRGVLVKVVNHIEYGKSLARRGAVFGSKQEFLAAVKLIAQTIDQMRGGSMYTEAFYDAIQALNDSHDFYKAQAEQFRRVNVVAIAKEHRSKVADPDYLRGLNPMQAMQLYYDFVQDKLVACSGNTVVASEALYCLGKLHKVKAKKQIDGNQLDNAKSVVFYNAALNCDPKNYKSANELGVILAQSGRFVEAKELFLKSLKVKQVSKVWANLASVHRQLGETKLAQLAEVEYQNMLEGPAANRIIWVKPETFANQNKQSLPVRSANNAMVPHGPPKQKSNRGLRNMMKKLF